MCRRRRTSTSASRSAQGMARRSCACACAPGRVQLWVSTVKATPPNIAYVHTKQYQLAQRRAAGFRFNAEEALRNAERSSVPFED